MRTHAMAHSAITMFENTSESPTPLTRAFWIVGQFIISAIQVDGAHLGLCLVCDDKEEAVSNLSNEDNSQIHSDYSRVRGNGCRMKFGDPPLIQARM